MPPEKEQRFDLCVIGCGAAGFAAAVHALDMGRSVCLVEEGELGGAAVKRGALASKTLYELSKDFAVASKTDRGFRAGSLEVDYPQVRATVLAAVAEKQAQMRRQLEWLAARGGGAPAFVCRSGTARLEAPGRVVVQGPDGPPQRVAADRVLVATGSRPRRLARFPVDQRRVLDSDGILNLSQFPRTLVIVGAGIVGCEYATVFANYGRTRVLLVDREERVLPYEDEDVSAFVAANLARAGVEILQAAELEDIDADAGGLLAGLRFADGRRRRLHTDALLFSIGRTANSGGLGLERAGAATGENGVLITDDSCRAADGLWAAGDVAHQPNLVSVAERQGRRAVAHMFGARPQPVDYGTLPTVMFFSPPVAAVGLSERQCRRQGIPYRAGVYSLRLLNRAIAMRATTGFVKIVVSDDGRQRILGMRAAGPQVSSMIMAVALLIEQDRAFSELSGAIYPHPTMAEAIQECLRLLRGDTAYKPAAFPDWLKVRRWRPQSPGAGEQRRS